MKSEYTDLIKKIESIENEIYELNEKESRMIDVLGGKDAESGGWSIARSASESGGWSTEMPASRSTKNYNKDAINALGEVKENLKNALAWQAVVPVYALKRMRFDYA